MKDSAYKFFRDVIYTTATSYTILSFALLALLTLFSDNSGGGDQTLFQAFSYLFGKLFCVFLFSLGLGFINRVFMLKKSQALLRLIHFFGTFIWFLITMVVLFLGFFDMEKGLSTRGAMGNIILFLVFYPICAGVSALFRALITPKDKKEYKSILD